MTPPSELQLDLLTACQRIRQVWEEDGGGTSLGELLLQRLFTCDVPRLEGHLTPETLAWAAEQGIPAPVAGWDAVIMHLTEAQKIAATLPRNHWWNTYVDEIHADSALSELIEAAKSEQRPSTPA